MRADGAMLICLRPARAANCGIPGKIWHWRRFMTGSVRMRLLCLLDTFEIFSSVLFDVLRLAYNLLLGVSINHQGDLNLDVKKVNTQYTKAKENQIFSRILDRFWRTRECL